MEKPKNLFITIALISLFLLFVPLATKTNRIKVLNFEEESQKKEIRNLKAESNELKLIQVSKYPKKEYYKEGETFDKKGMVVKAIYSDKSEKEITDYSIDKKDKPLTIYDSVITISYNKKNTTLNIKITNDEGEVITPNPSEKKYTVELKEGITRFEMEDADLSNWVVSQKEESNQKIIKRDDASRKAFVSGVDEHRAVQLIFNLDLKFNSKFVMSVSYSPKEKYKKYDADLTRLCVFRADENKIVPIGGQKKVSKRDDITKWQLIKYKEFILSKGNHTLSLNGGTKHSDYGIPNIDYIDFKTEKVDEAPIDPDISIIPPNDFHNFLQYQYIIDDPHNISYYSSGILERSKPNGNLLNFSDSVKENSNSYIIQISSSKDFDSSDTKIIEKLSKPQYIIKNLKLGQNIYYRGGIDKSDIESSKIYELKVNTLPPRNVDVPGVTNFRDIGGTRTYLVENGIINQGLYFRSEEIDGIKSDGKKVMANDLGIKIEIDLRDDEYDNRKPPEIDGVKYHWIPIISESEELSKFDDFKEEYYKIYDLISNADKKPVVLHCASGVDRTGILTFSLLTLLGCEKDDIYRDYLFSNFAAKGPRDGTEVDKWYKKLDAFEGKTIAEKSKKWLLSKGIEEDKLEHIREIFINGYK